MTSLGGEQSPKNREKPACNTGVERRTRAAGLLRNQALSPLTHCDVSRGSLSSPIGPRDVYAKSGFAGACAGEFRVIHSIRQNSDVSGSEASSKRAEPGSKMRQSSRDVTAARRFEGGAHALAQRSRVLDATFAAVPDVERGSARRGRSPRRSLPFDRRR